MKLIYKPTGRVVTEGDFINYNFEIVKIHNCPKPHKPSSEGKMQIMYERGNLSAEYYCSVFDCEWIEREDRLETSELCEQCNKELHDPIHCGTCGAFDHPFRRNGETKLGHGGLKQPTPVGGFVPSLPSVSSSDQTAQLMAEVKENFKKIQETLNEIKALLL